MGRIAPTLVGQEVAQGHLLLLLFGSCSSSRQPPFRLSRATPSSSRLEVRAAIMLEKEVRTHDCGIVCV